MIRPSLLITVELQGDLDPAATKRVLARAFSYVAPVSVVARAGAPEGTGTVVCLNVSLPRAYWPARDGDAAANERADETWNGILMPWLRDKLAKVGSVIKGYDRFAAEQGDAPIAFEAVAVVLGDVRLTLNLDERHAIPQGALDMVERYRTLRGAGCAALAGATEVEMPALLRAEAPQGTTDQDGAQPADRPADAQAAPATTLADLGTWRVHDAQGGSALLDAQTGEPIEGSAAAQAAGPAAA